MTGRDFLRCEMVLAPLFSFLLTGCFASTTPLINTANASTPFKDGTIVTEYGNCDTSQEITLSCKGFIAQGTSVLSLKDGAYQLQIDPTDDAAQVLQAQNPGGDMTMLLKDIGEGDYVIQLDMGEKAVDADRYVYELFKLEGKVGYLYLMNCDPAADERYVRSGELTAITTASLIPEITPALMNSTCKIDSIQHLATIFKARLAHGLKPDKKFEIAN
jgi:hypothetical protein